ncbi:hypothetical protein [Nocardioides alcanivorans]|uniref:hypothetical protein n=1 Tax=Nocardioides alcanivorans TaxID=2897352 RepID=UPI001F191C20|nr:hypothetical protein [Nocardioides alcanivorans]
MTQGGCGRPARDVAGELADWLEGLGLADTLAEAGLPTYVRTERGVHWTAPGTGEPLTDAELFELESILRDQGEEPDHAVPLALVQVARRAAERARLLASAVLDYAALAELRGGSENAARFWVHKAAQDQRALLLTVDDRVVIPAFQFDPGGELRADLSGVLDVLLASGMDQWAVWGWLTGPVALLSGGVPVERVTDPEEQPLVRHAAHRLAARAAGTG